MIALIMAGGFGTRFWPQSRAHMPKQFLKVVGDKSMIRLTVERLSGVIATDDIYVVTAKGQEDLVYQHLPQIPRENVILEPFGMNTAPCIALSTAYLQRKYPADETVLVLPADHVIRDLPAFHSSIRKASEQADNGNLVTFGIVPDHPATGYGYIEAGELVSGGAYRVLRFKEKPDRATAEAFLASGKFYWNSGMFCWQLKTISTAFATHQSAVTDLTKEINQLWDKGITDISPVYAQMPKLPIDIAIMEPAQNRVVIPVDLGWSDVGSWKALSELSPADADGNSIPAGGIAISSTSNYVYSDKFIALIGVDNLCLVETNDAILITTKDRAEDVKLIVDKLKNDKRTELL